MTKKKILLVDDEKNLRILVKEVLSEEGYTVRDASSGMECMKKLKKFRPDLIIMDMMMPKMSGFQVLHRLQRSPVTRRIPVFVVSALEQQQILHLPGVSHVFPKGQFRLQELLTAVKDAIETPKTSSSGNLIGSLNGISG